MANENKNKTQGGVIKTMQHDLERIKNPAPSFASESTTPQPQKESPMPEKNLQIEASSNTPIQEGVDSKPEPVEEKGIRSAQEQPLEDPALEKLFNLDMDQDQEPDSQPNQSSQKIQVTDQQSIDDNQSNDSQDISSVVSTLRQELPNLEQPSQTSKEEGLKTEIGESLARLKGFGNEMESDDHSASVGSQAANLNENSALSSGQNPSSGMPAQGVMKKNPYSRIDDIRAKDTMSNAPQDLTPDIPQSSGTSKLTYLLIGLVLLFVAILGGGGYFFFFASPNDTVVTDEAPQDEGDEDVGEFTEDEIDSLVDPLQPDTIVQVTPTANIRADILTALQGQPEDIELIEIYLVDESENKVSLEQIESQLTISVPTEMRDNLSDYMLVAVRDNGRFEIGAVLELQDNLAESYLQTWQDTVIQDLSALSLSQEVMTVPSDAELQSVEKTQLSTGETFNNFFYNYETGNRSTDITAKDNIILIGTTQGTMEYLIQNVFIQ